MSGIQIVEAAAHQTNEAARVASEAMIGLPEVVPVLRGRRDRMEATFRIGLSKMPGSVFLAKDEEEIVGVMRVVAWPDCKPTPLQALRMLPAAIRALKGSFVRAGRFQATWAKHDPQRPHLHLDPLAVKVGRQGQGIGSQLMAVYCRQMDGQKIAGYLETGTRDNVRFYERFGFRVTEEVQVFGVPTYMMWRDATQ